MLLPTDFKNWTREQRIEMDGYRDQAFYPTEQESSVQNEKDRQYKLSYLKEKLSLYGIEFSERDDYSQIYHEYIFNNPPMNERLGSADRMQERYDFLVEQCNNLEGLYAFVLLYEG